MSILSLATILCLNRWRPKWPSFLIAVGLAAVVGMLFHLDMATVGSRFGGVPSTLPHPSLPGFTWDKLQVALSNGGTIALLAAIESLLSAVVADGMTGRRHRSNCELVAQGIANGAAAVFGGICVTGLIARTATNIRSGARGPVSGMFHALYLLLFILVAAPLAAYIPLASLGAVLAVVAWNMAEKAELWAMLRSSRGDAAVLLATFLLTVFVDLTTGIAVGVVLGAFLFLHRMADAVEVQTGTPLMVEDRSDFDEARTTYDPAIASNPDVMVYHISGALFFGATAALSTVLDRIGRYPKTFILDFEAVPLIDSTAAYTLHGFIKKLEWSKVNIYFAGVRSNVQRTLLAAGLQEPMVHYVENVGAVPLASR